MKKALLIPFFLLSLLAACQNDKSAREVEDFNSAWKFHLGDVENAQELTYDDADWTTLNVPHDWSIEAGYQQEGTAASTGFVPGGIGWYRKTFDLPKSDEGKHISIVFDGVYNNSTVWINGHKLGFRPNGYSTFTYDLSPYLNFESSNTIAVEVDRKAYADSRWYTGSGIYRKVQLIKKQPLHIAQWGIRITTPDVSKEEASVNVKVDLENASNEIVGDVAVNLSIYDNAGELISVKQQILDQLSLETTLQVKTPQLWSVDSPSLYSLKAEVLHNNKLVDNTTETFGIRYFKFDANEGFSLNGKRMKLKGVNLHHDAGAVGSAVPKSLWEYRVDKLKSIGVNAIRMSHNPHSKELMEVCDEKGILVMNEAFDEWSKPKAKSLVFLGDNKASEEASRCYTEHFEKWAERDLKDLIARDYNHPSVIMWSIGNEIEWTYPYVSKTYNDVNGKVKYNQFEPSYDTLKIKAALDKNTGGVDELVNWSKKLVQWVKEEDTTRYVISGSVHPSIACVSGYAESLDILGFNYRAMEYDRAHAAFPEMIILGSENWGAYSEWKNCIERDFVGGIFAWTGFAYLGEAGPWPRKGLEIAFFDYAGNKTPRGHFFECLWKEDPKVYLVSTPAEESEFSYDEDSGWQFDIDLYEAPFWAELRLWEWYKTYPGWNYVAGKDIVVQCYTNCEEAELFLNGKSLGKQSRLDFADDNIIKWLVPYTAGELKVLAYNDKKQVDSYIIQTNSDLERIVLESYKSELVADGYDLSVVKAKLIDSKGEIITDSDQELTFELQGNGINIGVDNGWERNVASHKTDLIKTYQGNAFVHIQSTQEAGTIKLKAKCGSVYSETLTIITK